MDNGSLIEELEGAIALASSERRDEALWQVTNLFISGAGRYSEDQIGLFDDVIGRLASVIEATARAKLASRLAPVPTAPVNVIKTLAADEAIEVAGPVLTHSERLDEATLVHHAKAKGQQHLLAISRRRFVSEAVTDVLVARGDQQVVQTVASNPGARFSNGGFGLLVKRSGEDDVLAERVGLRRDIPRQHFLKLIANASETVRAKLAQANPHAADAVQSVLAEVVGRIRAEAVTASRDYGEAKRRIEELARGRALEETEIYQCAKARKFEEVAVAFSTLCGLPVEVVEAAMLDERPDMVLILAKTAGLSWTTVKVVLLLRSGDRGVSALDLENALKRFERLQLATAQRVVAFYQMRRNVSEDFSEASPHLAATA